FLNFAPKNSIKLSYAASISNTLDKGESVFFKNELTKFDYISVREISGKNQLKNLTHKPVEITVDTTLLLTKNECKKLISNRSTNEKYILVYDLITDPTIVELANKLAKKMDAKIICYSNG